MSRELWLQLLLLITLALSPTVVAARALTAQNLQAEGCGTLDNAFGPYNYNSARGRRQWPIVEKFHFTQSVRLLQHGHTGTLPQDLDYTLRAFPNQPLALYDMARYQLRHGYPVGGSYSKLHYYPAQCYFKRAILFVPNDGVVRMIYGIYLQRKGDYRNALKRYVQASKLIKPTRSAELHYDMGLLYFQMGDYNKARIQAQKAYTKGYPLPGLRERLRSIGRWTSSSILTESPKERQGQAGNN